MLDSFHSMDNNNLKLMCSYGGRIHYRPHHHKLSYLGGHTKILTISRNIGFANLIARLNALCGFCSEIRLKYQLPGLDLDALVSVFDDEDVENMVFECDRVSTTSGRLRLFVFLPGVSAMQVREMPVQVSDNSPVTCFGGSSVQKNGRPPRTPKTPINKGL